MSEWDESKHPRDDDNGRFVDVDKMSTKELLEFGNKLGVEMPENENFDVYKARIKEALESNDLQCGNKGDTINLTKQEWAQYYKIIADELHGDFVYRTSNNGRMIPLGNKLLLDNGNFEKPIIHKIIVFRNSDLMYDYINRNKR